MQEYIDFIGKNPLYFIGFAILLGLIIKLEVSRATRKYKLVNVNQAVKIMNNDDTVIVDVREDKEMKDGTIIKGAQHITLGQISERIGLLGTNKQVPVLVYCRTGHRGNAASQIITKAGFEDVSSLTGGIQAWETASLPTVKR